MSYVDEVIEKVVTKNPGEPEFISHLEYAPYPIDHFSI